MNRISETASPAAAPGDFARRLSALHVIAFTVIALLTLAGYVALDRSVALARETIVSTTAPAPATNATPRRVSETSVERQLDVLLTIGRAICVSVLAALLAASLAVFGPLARRIADLTRDAAELARFATTDPLTGMLNQHSFQARGAIEIQKARRYQRPLSMLMIDADQLSAIEGTHGPSGGQTVLKALTSSFYAGTRVTDLLARVDADQFAILLPETDCAGAELLAERLRSNIGNLSMPIDDKHVSCTLSIGVAAAEKDASFLRPTFKRAEEALYEAQIRGRNRVVVAAA